MPKDKREKIKLLFSASHFIENADPIVRELGEYLESSQKSQRALQNGVDPLTLPEQAGAFLDQSPVSLSALSNWYLLNSRLLHSPHYMGHQVPAPLPTASLFSFMSSFANQGGAVFEMGPSLAAIERAVIKRLGHRIGWKAGFDGVVTNGGTLSNLTAILTARNIRYPNAWKEGMAGASSKTKVILTSQDSHYSIARAAGILGLGTNQILKMPVNAQRQVTGEALEKVLLECEKKGQEVFCVVGSSGTTPTGSFDHIRDLGKICNGRGIWFHIDGAHGASVLFSEKHRHLVNGIELADSVTWDAHKMLFVHSLSTQLLYKNARDSFLTFQQDAPYLFNGEEITDSAFLDAGLRTVECTRQPLALPLWGVWSLYGPQVFEDLIDICFESTQMLYETIKARTDFKALHEPQANILCFRYLPPSLNGASASEISVFQLATKEALLKTGKFYITSTVLDGVAALRVTLMNPLIDQSHLQALLNAVVECSPRG